MTSPAAAAPTWPEALDAMERRLDAAARTVLEHAEAPAAAVVLPAEPLPAVLAPRAAALLEATKAMERTVGRALGEVGERLGRAATGRRRARQWEQPAAPAYVDRRA